MGDWLERRWNDIRGNFVWWLVFTAASTLFGSLALFWRWFLALPLAVQLLSVSVFVLSVACTVLSVMLLEAHKRPLVTISGPPPAILFPRPDQEVQVIEEAGPRMAEPELPIDTMALKYVCVPGAGGGIQVRMQNVGLKPLHRCELHLESFASFHAERQQFREPSFAPRIVIKAGNLEPERGSISGEYWLIRSTSAEFTTMLIPNNTMQPQTVTYSAPGIWEAGFRLCADGQSRVERLYFSWKPGSIPEVIPSPVKSIRSAT